MQTAQDDIVPPLIELTNITKSFSSVVALDNVSFVLRPGTIHALLGENGAGKTTLMYVAYGMLTPDKGGIRINGQDAALHTPLDAITAGIGMVHQHFTLVPAMTVAENLALGGRGLLKTNHARTQVRSISERTGFALDPDARVEDLPVGAQQRVEIAKALTRNARILIMDEPTAVLAPSEVADLLKWLRAYVQHGNAVVLITHKLREAFAVADDVTVLRRGRVVLTSPRAAVPEQVVSSAMIGEAELAIPDRIPNHGGDVVFDARGITIKSATGTPAIRNATFAIRSGELIGIAGVEGAGQRELLRALAGRMDTSHGTLVRPDVVGFVPEDRHADAVMLERSLTENVALRGAAARSRVMQWQSIGKRTSSLVKVFDVRANSESDTMRSLSGGNQQKLVLARELESASGTGPHALVIENPTRGLDVRATADVHRRLREACTQGAAVVMYSSDVDEVLALASRILVVYAGTVREVSLERDAVGRAMVGFTHEELN